jgi:hypothetical protein
LANAGLPLFPDFLAEFLLLQEVEIRHRDPDAVTILGTAAPGMSAGRLPLRPCPAHPVFGTLGMIMPCVPWRWSARLA